MIAQGPLRVSIAVRQYHETDDLLLPELASGHQPTEVFLVQFGDNVGTDKYMVFDCDVEAQVYMKEFDYNLEMEVVPGTDGMTTMTVLAKHRSQAENEPIPYYEWRCVAKRDLRDPVTLEAPRPAKVRKMSA